MLGVEAVLAALHFYRDAARRSGEGEQAAGRRVVLGEPLAARAEARTERVVAAGVESDERRLALGLREAAEQGTEIDAFLPDVGCGVDVAVDREKVVAPLELGGVAGVVEEGDADARARHRAPELVDRAEHLHAGRVDFQVDREARLFQQSGHRARVVLGALERIAVAIPLVADDERGAAGGATDDGGERRQRLTGEQHGQRRG